MKTKSEERRAQDSPDKSKGHPYVQVGYSVVSVFIWGFDYKFTTSNLNKPLNFTPLAIYVLKTTKVFFAERIVGEIVVKSPYQYVEFTDGVGTPDPNSRNLVSWCF